MMLRFLFSILVMFCLAASFATPAEAGRVGAQFTVGIRVIGKNEKPRGSVARQEQYTFNAAHVTLIQAQYQSIRKISVSDDVYWFIAERQGVEYRVAVSRIGGEIVTIMPR